MQASVGAGHFVGRSDRANPQVLMEPEESNADRWILLAQRDRNTVAFQSLGSGQMWGMLGSNVVLSSNVAISEAVGEPYTFVLEPVFDSVRGGWGGVEWDCGLVGGVLGEGRSKSMS